MKLRLHFILVNSEFDQALADQYFNGKESEENIKHLWEDDFTVAESVKEYKILNNASYTLEGFLPGNKSFRFEIPDVTLVNCTTESGSLTQFAVSGKLIKKTEVKNDKAKAVTSLYFYLKDKHPMVNPMNGIYILKKDFPKELQSE